MWDPVARFALDRLPGQVCKEALNINSLEKLPALEIARICNWLIEKIDSFSSLNKAQTLDAEEQVCTYSQRSLCCSSTCRFRYAIGCLEQGHMVIATKAHAISLVGWLQHDSSVTAVHGVIAKSDKY